MRITSLTDATATDTSDGTFTIGNLIALINRTATPDLSLLGAVTTRALTGTDSLVAPDLRGGTLLKDDGSSETAPLGNYGLAGIVAFGLALAKRRARSNSKRRATPEESKASVKRLEPPAR